MKSRDAAVVEEAAKLPDLLPVLPLKDTVVFPYIIVPVSVAREASVTAVDQSLAAERSLVLVAQRSPETEEVGAGDIFSIGTAATILRMLKLPDGRIRLLVQGVTRVRIDHLAEAGGFLQAHVERIVEAVPSPLGLEVQALLRSVKESLDRIVALGKTISPEVLVIAANLDEPGRLADLVASNLEITLDEAQKLLETFDPIERLVRVAELVQREVQLLTMQQEITSQARGEMDRSQREFYLRQQLKAIQQELGEGDDLAEEIAKYRKLGEERGLTEEAREELERQLRRLERSHPDSAEASVVRTYLEWLTGMPWANVSMDHLDLDHAKQVLDDDHYDLEKIKERILEYLAVRKLRGGGRGAILCFVGPPGVGKTSLGRSIARAMDRKFVRLSLGGVRDEAEIRGHRRTYVGALPGRILQGVHQAGTSNPVFMLDEIDKIGSDFRGDPSSALLEVLDPEQNSTFRDHYMSVAYDLSQVLFITTANVLEPIQPAFLDRMEVLRLAGYTIEEKLAIARRHLIPKRLAESGIGVQHLTFSDPGLRRVITAYTREAGLRNLEREIGSVCRKIAFGVARGENVKVQLGPRNVEKYLGQPKHWSEDLLDSDRVGVATGLAWTAAGGELMFIEVLAAPGKGNLVLTGQLGDVMKESAQAALTWARAWASRSSACTPNFFAENDLHVHVPAGAIPKDGPSAGITIAAALVSALTGRKVDRKLALTGEITLRGDVLPVGGLKEKLLAAQAAGIRGVVLPRLNRRDLVDVPASATRALEFVFVDSMDEVIENALIKGAAQKPKAKASVKLAPRPRRDARIAALGRRAGPSRRR